MVITSRPTRSQPADHIQFVAAVITSAVIPREAQAVASAEQRAADRVPSASRLKSLPYQQTHSPRSLAQKAPVE